MKKRWSILSAVLCVALLTGGCGTGSKNDAGTGKEQTFSHETREENEHQSNLDVLQPSAYEEGRKSVPGIDITEVQKAISETPGIGAKRLEAIMESLNSKFAKEEDA